MGNAKALHPWEGITQAKYTGPKMGSATDWKELNEQGKYSWLKTPLWRGKVCEVGPLARYIIIYTKAKQNLLPDMTWAEKMMVDQVEAVSKVLKLAPEVWLPTMVGRTAARRRWRGSSLISWWRISTREIRRWPTWRSGIPPAGRKKPGG